LVSEEHEIKALSIISVCCGDREQEAVRAQKGQGQGGKRERSVTDKITSKRRDRESGEEEMRGVTDMSIGREVWVKDLIKF
jgi:hypothetical protein